MYTQNNQYPPYNPLFFCIRSIPCCSSCATPIPSSFGTPTGVQTGRGNGGKQHYSHSNHVWEDMEEDEDKTCEDDADDDYDMEDINDAALSKITNFAYKTDNNVSHFSTL